MKTFYRIRHLSIRLLGLAAAGILALSPAAAFALSPTGISAAHTTTPSTSYSGKNYVALGDSVAAGVGLTPLTAPTADDTACGRTAEAYPQLLATDLGMNLTSVACSGAVASDLYYQQDVGDRNLPAQIDAAFASGTPDVVTLTVGANDLHWNDFVHYCYIAACGGERSDWVTKAARGYLRAELFWAFGEINTLSNGHPPKVIVTGYFTPLSTEALACGDTQGLTTDEINWLNSQATQLNQAIYSVTQWFDFTTYVAVNFGGHELCTADPWVQGVSAAQPYHPTAAGQRAMAYAIRAELGL
jgi:lysophospholipase L1-like esterase